MKAGSSRERETTITVKRRWEYERKEPDGRYNITQRLYETQSETGQRQDRNTKGV